MLGWAQCLHSASHCANGSPGNPAAAGRHIGLPAASTQSYRLPVGDGDGGSGDGGDGGGNGGGDGGGYGGAGGVGGATPEELEKYLRTAAGHLRPGSSDANAREGRTCLPTGRRPGPAAGRA